MNNVTFPPLRPTAGIQQALIVVIPMSGHLLPTYTLAKELVRRGVAVSYPAFDDVESVIRAEGFGFRSLGDRAQMRAVHQDFARLNIRSGIARIRALIDHTMQLALASQADVFLIDADMPYLAAMLADRGKEVVLLHTNFRRMPLDLSVPPDTAFAPPGTWANRTKNTWRWLLAYATSRVSLHYAVSWFAGPEKWTREYARTAGIGTYSSHPGLALKLPSIVLAPAALDYFRRDRPEYLRDAVDRSRRQSPADFPRDRDCAVLCSLGTHTRDYAWAADFFRKVFAAARLRPSWRFTVQCGAELHDRLAPECPPNAVLLRDAPILKLLEQSDVMITHAGFGSMKECVELEVPMVACPCKWDQIGNAGKIAGLGIGVSLPTRQVDPSDIVAACEHVATEEFRERIRKLKRDDAISRPVREVVTSFMGEQIARPVLQRI